MSRPNPPGISHVTFYLPSVEVDNEDLASRLGFERNFLDQKVGITKRYRAKPRETTTDMAYEAARRLLEETRLDPAALDALFVVTQTADRCLPHTAALLQQRLGLPTKLASFDLNLGCSGYVYGLSVADSLLRANDWSYVLLVTVDRYSSIMNPMDRSTAPLFSDASAATLLETTAPRYVLGRTTFGTNGCHAEAITTRRKPDTEGAWPRLHMDGRAVFSFMMNTVPGDIQRCLSLNGLTKAEIDRWVLHQASGFMVRRLAKQLELPENRVVLDASEVGNTVSSSIPIALARHVFCQPTRPSTLLLSGFGVGASWASTVLRSLPG